MNIFYAIGWFAGSINKQFNSGFQKAESGLPIRSITGNDNLDRIYMLLQQEGSYIRAIRMYKDLYRCETLEAKDAISEMITKYNLDVEKIKAQITPDLMGMNLNH